MSRSLKSRRINGHCSRLERKVRQKKHKARLAKAKLPENVKRRQAERAAQDAEWRKPREWPDNSSSGSYGDYGSRGWGSRW